MRRPGGGGVLGRALACVGVGLRLQQCAFCHDVDCLQVLVFFFFFQAEDGIRDRDVTGVQTCVLPIVSGSVLLGWQLELPILRTILPGRAAMSPLTAVTFVLVATALWLETESSGGHRPIRWLARAAAGLVLLVGLVTVFGYDLGENLSLVQSRFLDRLG